MWAIADESIDEACIR